MPMSRGPALMHVRVEVRLPVFLSWRRIDCQMADGIRASRGKQSIADGHTNNRFGLLPREDARSQARTNDSFAPLHSISTKAR